MPRLRQLDVILPGKGLGGQRWLQTLGKGWEEGGVPLMTI
jgi:hypothetical protein